MLEIDANKLFEKMNNHEDFILLDVRRDDEYDMCHIKNSLHIPLNQLTEDYHKINKEKEVIIYCHHGMRSLKALHILKELGYENVYSLRGGIDYWSKNIDSTIPTY